MKRLLFLTLFASMGINAMDYERVVTFDPKTKIIIVSLNQVDKSKSKVCAKKQNQKSNMAKNREAAARFIQQELPKLKREIENRKAAAHFIDKELPKLKRKAEKQKSRLARKQQKTNLDSDSE